MHADYGTGSFIGVDGAEQTTGDIWGHVLMNAMALTPGNHEFEALGFDACCDGHAELEVHLPCDTSVDPWRIVVAGDQDCMRCDVPVDGATCSANTASAGCCGDSGANGAAGGCGLDASRCASGDIYMGCYMDGAASGQFCGDTDGGCSGTDRDVSAEQYSIEPARATLERCSNYCYTRGYTYYAMQYARECWCDNDYGSGPLGEDPASDLFPEGRRGNGVVPDSDCNMPCSGDESQMCGGSWRKSKRHLPLRARLHGTKMNCGCWRAGNSVYEARKLQRHALR